MDFLAVAYLHGESLSRTLVVIRSTGDSSAVQSSLGVVKRAQQPKGETEQDLNIVRLRLRLGRFSRIGARGERPKEIEVQLQRML